MSEEYSDLGVLNMTAVEPNVPKTRSKNRKGDKVVDSPVQTLAVTLSEDEEVSGFSYETETLGAFKLYPSAELPRYATEEAGCFDLKAYLGEEVVSVKGYNANNEPIVLAVRNGYILLEPGWRVLVPTGLIFDIPPGYAMNVLPRSSTGYKTGLEMPHSIGFIDSDYVEECFLLLKNTSNVRVRIENGDRLAQAELRAIEGATIKQIFTRPAKKGNRVGGFGTTGNK